MSAITPGSSIESARKEANVDWVARFLDVACPDHHVRSGPDHAGAQYTAMRILEHNPHVALDSFYTAIVIGNLREVERVVAEHPLTAVVANRIGIEIRATVPSSARPM